MKHWTDSRIFHLLRLVAVFLILVGLLPAPAASAAPASAALRSQAVPYYEPAKCTFKMIPGVQEGRDVECGFLTVPLHYADPQGPTIQLAVAVIKSLSPNKAADPIVFAQGGPGGSTIDYYTKVLFTSRLRAERDLILFDQRGTLYSKPALVCPEVMDETIKTLNQVLGVDESNQVFNQAMMTCRARLEKEGIDLSAFNSVENAHDVNSLRVALGLDKINLYGVSYGTLLALHTIREHPEALRSVVIDSVVPPQTNFIAQAPFSEDRAFTELFTACASDARCSAAYPNLEKTFFDLIQRLGEKPATLRLKDADTGKTYDSKMDGNTFLSYVFQIMYASDFIPILPRMIQDTANGRYASLERIATLLVFDRSMSYGMYFSVACAEDGNFDPSQLDYSTIRPQIAKDERVGNQYFVQLCKDWKVTRLDPKTDDPVVSDLPTLVFNGRFDPITPAKNGEEAAKTLSNSFVYTFPNTAHGALTSSACVDEIMLQFIRDPQAKPDSSCIAQIPPVHFLVPGEVIDLPVVPLLANLETGAVVQTILLALLVMFLLSALLVYPILWIVRLVRKTPRAPLSAGMRLAPWAAALAGLIALVFCVALLAALVSVIASNNLMILYLGVPGSIRWIFFLPPLIVLLTLGMAAAAVMSWVRRSWKVGERVYFSLLTAAALGIVVLLAITGSLTALLG